MESLTNALYGVKFDENLEEGFEYKKVAYLGTEDPKACYNIVNMSEKIIKDTGLEVVNTDALDYLVPRDKEAIRKGHKADLPISFLTIQEGEVDKGKAWYLYHYPKLTEDMAELLARYNWGDMKFMTKKSIRNDRKKYAKKHNKQKGVKDDNGVKVQKGAFLVTFD